MLCDSRIRWSTSSELLQKRFSLDLSLVPEHVKRHISFSQVSFCVRKLCSYTIVLYCLTNHNHQSSQLKLLYRQQILEISQRWCTFESMSQQTSDTLCRTCDHVNELVSDLSPTCAPNCFHDCSQGGLGHGLGALGGRNLHGPLCGSDGC
ncbi:hypothetical protein BDW69DRAFT_79463 [Aspergillus filifer]